MKSILIVKTSSIGDVIHAFPVLDYLREQFPGAKIDWVVEKSCADLLRAHPRIDHVLTVDTRAWRKALMAPKTRQEFAQFVSELRREKYDFLIDLQGNCKSALITLLANAQAKIGFDWKSVPEKPNVFVTTHRYFVPPELSVRKRYLHLLQCYLQEMGEISPQPVELKISAAERERLDGILAQPAIADGEPLMVCFGSKWRNKQLKEETLVELLKRIDQELQASFVFIWGDAEEQKIAEAFQAFFPTSSISVGGLSLNLWQALMTHMRGVLAVDSAALHLCGTTATPSFSIFGPSSASFYKPEGERHVAYQGSCPYGRTFVKRCPILRTCASGACMRNLDPDEIFKSFATWWENKTAPKLALI